MVQKLSDKVYLIDTEALGASLYVAMYAIRDEKTALIDNSYASAAPTILEKLRKAGINPADVDYLIPTHVHLDHAGATGALLRHMPKAQVIIHERGAKHLIDPTKLLQSVATIYSEKEVERFGTLTPLPPERVKPVGGELELSLGGISLRVFPTPGHAPHHLSVYDSSEGFLFTGDAVGVKYPDFPLLLPTTPPPSFDAELAIETLKNLKRLGARALLTPHFGPLLDVEGSLEANIRTIESWRDAVFEMLERENDAEKLIEERSRFVAAQAGVPPSALPEKIRVNIRLNVLGLRAYHARLHAPGG